MQTGHRSQSLCRLFLLVPALPASTALAQAAFPGAAGFGAGALGGRGGDVYHVTSLADTLTPGTLRYGLRESGFPVAGRTIVFDVGGVINLTASLDVKNISKVTIAGQTAPGGITLTGRTLQITGSNNKTTHNIILQHIAVRGPSSEDALSIKGAGHTYNIMVDHVSTSWSQDELLSSTQSINNITVSNSFITEALNPAGHSYGSLVRPLNDSTLSVSNVTYHHNLYANNKSRNPRPGTYDGKTLNFEFNNNVVYNWSDRAGYAGGSSEGDTEFVRMNYVGNYLVAGPVTPSGAAGVAFTRDASNSPIDLKVWQSGNVIDSNKNLVRDGVDTGWGMFRNWNGSTLSAFPDADKMATPFAFAMTSYDTAADAYARVLASGGAQPWNRAGVDVRLANNVKNMTGSVINSLPVEWNQILAEPMRTRPAGYDTDFDGMPNWWETLRGTNPSLADHNVMTATGYSNLENFLHHLNRQANWAVDGDASWGGILNWAGERPDAMEATAGFGPVITAPRTVTLDAPLVAVGGMNFDSPHAYTIAPGAGGSILVDVVSGTAEFAVRGGLHQITAPIVLADHLRVDVLSGQALLIGEIDAAGKNVAKVGGGTLAVASIRTPRLDVLGGSMGLGWNAVANDPARSSRAGSLTIADGALLDLANNAMVLDGGTPGVSADAVRQHLVAGRIASVDAPAGHGIAYADNTVLNLSTFAGQSVAPTDTLLMYTRLGDANLDGVAGIADFSLLGAHFNAPGLWTDGDFDYDGAVGIGDFAQLAANFNQSVAARGGVVPEPVTGIMLAAAGLLWRRRDARH